MKKEHKKLIFIWIAYTLAIQLIANCFYSRGMVFPVVIEIIYVLIQVLPLLLLLFVISRNKENKAIYRYFASIMLVTGCIALVATVLFPILGPDM